MLQNIVLLMRRRWLPVCVALLAVVLIVWGLMDFPKSHPSAPPITPTVTTSTPSSSTSGAQVDSVFVARVYDFVAAYELPASDHRNQLLQALSSADGYTQVYRDPKSASAAEIAAGNIQIAVVSDQSTIQVNPFDGTTDAVSVVVNATIRTTTSSGYSTTLSIPQLIMSWVRTDGVWQFAYLQ